MRAPVSRARRLIAGERAALVTLVVTVVCLRLVLLVALFAEDPTRVVRFDTAGYEAPAAALREHGVFAESAEEPDRPELLRTPGYPVFLAAVYGLSGGSRLAVVVVQTLLSGLTMACAYVAARAVWSHRAGMAAAALLAVDPLQTYYAGVVMSEALFTTLVAAGVAAAVLACRDPARWWLVLLAGSSLAGATLVRPVGYYLPLVIAAAVVACHRWLRLRALRAVLLCLLLLAPSVLAVGAWMVRNGEAAGVYELSTVRSINMLYYRAAAVLALEEGTSRAQMAARLRVEQPADLSEAELDRWRMRQGVALIAARPGGYVRVAARGAALMLLGPGDASLREYLGTDGRLARVLIVGPGLGYLTVLYLAVGAGAVALVRRRTPGDWATLALLLGTVAYFVVVSSGGEAYSRFRVPFAPVLAMLGGVGFAFLSQQRQERRGGVQPKTHAD